MKVTFDPTLYAFAHGHARHRRGNISHPSALRELMIISFAHSMMCTHSKKAAAEAKRRNTTLIMRRT